MVNQFALHMVEGTARPSEPPALHAWHAVRSMHDQHGPCGDTVIVLPLGSGRTAIVVIDIAGHGVARAALSWGLAEAITTALLRGASPAEALGCADEELRISGDALPYAVAFAALVHPELRTIVYASAGHDVAFVVADDGRVRHLAPTSSMLGIPALVHTCDAVFVLNEVETLVIATDGIADSRPAGSVDFFGAGGVARAVIRSLRDGRDPAKMVLEAAWAHAGGRQVDDSSVVVTRIGPARTHTLTATPRARSNSGSVAWRCQGEEIGRVGLERKSLSWSYTANE